jgi:hypothetical protein
VRGATGSGWLSASWVVAILNMGTACRTNSLHWGLMMWPPRCPSLRARNIRFMIRPLQMFFSVSLTHTNKVSIKISEL